MTFKLVRIMVLSCLALCVTMVPMTGHAMITATYTGELYGIWETPYPNVDWNFTDAAGFEVGQMFTMTVTYDEGCSPTESVPGWAYYQDAVCSMSFTSGRFTAAAPVTGASVAIWDAEDGSGDTDVIAFYSDEPVAPNIEVEFATGVTDIAHMNHMAIRFWGADNTISSTALPLSPPEPGMWAESHGFFSYESIDHRAEITIRPIHTTSIPDPPAMYLLGSSLIGLAGFRRRFKK